MVVVAVANKRKISSRRQAIKSAHQKSRDLCSTKCWSTSFQLDFWTSEFA